MDITIDDSDLRRAIGRLLDETKRDHGVVLRENGRGIIRNIISVTPPAQGKLTGSKSTTGGTDIPGAKQRGENAVKRDIAQVLYGVTPEHLSRFVDEWEADFAHEGAKKVGVMKRKVLRTAGEVKAWHQARRTKRGRVPKIRWRSTTGIRRRDLFYLDVGYTTNSIFNSYRKGQLAKVGLLSSGWNAAAASLGLRLPRWITRHGTLHGSARIKTGAHSIEITAENAIRYAGDVEGLPRRIQWAVQRQAEAIIRRSDHALKKSAKKSGFK